jgi:hypothetical protein
VDHSNQQARIKMENQQMETLMTTGAFSDYDQRRAVRREPSEPD